MNSRSSFEKVKETNRDVILLKELSLFKAIQMEPTNPRQRKARQKVNSI